MKYVDYNFIERVLIILLKILCSSFKGMENDIWRNWVSNYDKSLEIQNIIAENIHDEGYIKNF